MVTTMVSEGVMAPLAARLDHFVRWFVNSSPEAMIELPQIGIPSEVATSRCQPGSAAHIRGDVGKS